MARPLGITSIEREIKVTHPTLRTKYDPMSHGIVISCSECDQVDTITDYSLMLGSEEAWGLINKARVKHADCEERQRQWLLPIDKRSRTMHRKDSSGKLVTVGIEKPKHKSIPLNSKRRIALED